MVINISFSSLYLHVKGHQDKDPQCQLSIAKQHNVKCDQLAKQYIHEQLTPSTT